MIGKISMVLAIVFAVALVLSILTGPVLLFGGFESAGVNQFEKASALNVSSLTIAVADIDVKMYPVKSDDFECNLVGSYAKNKYPQNVKLSVVRNEDSIYVTVMYPAIVLINKDFTLNIGVPSDYKDTITLTSVSGNIDIRNLTVSEVNSISGDVLIIDSSVDSVSTTSGNIDIDGPTEMFITTVSGNVLLETDFPLNIDFKTVSGRLQNDFGDESGYKVTVKTVSGDLSIEKV
jgi:hypothetical protein